MQFVWSTVCTGGDGSPSQAATSRESQEYFPTQGVCSTQISLDFGS